MKRLFLTLLLGMFLPVGAFAQVVVTSAADDGSAGTLRVAIANAVNGETITFATNLAGSTIPLNSTLTINTSLTIDASALPGGMQINGPGFPNAPSGRSNCGVQHRRHAEFADHHERL